MFLYFVSIKIFFQSDEMRALLFAFTKRYTRMIYRKRSTLFNEHRFILSELVIGMKNRSLVEVEIVVLID